MSAAFSNRGGGDIVGARAGSAYSQAAIGDGAITSLDADRLIRGPVYAVPVIENPRNDHWLADAIYRALELSLTLVAFIVLLPVMLVIALIIKLDSTGPALFRHVRTARSKPVRGSLLVDHPYLRPVEGASFEPDKYYLVPQTFVFVKFRGMYIDTSPSFTLQSRQEFENYTKDELDPRITRAGRILRKTTLDELPTLWFVLTGQMRLVGPRPETPELLHYYTAEQMYRFSISPGLTGLAQVHGRGLVTRRDMIAKDCLYVRTRSVWLNIKIIAQTVRLILTGHGAF